MTSVQPAPKKEPTPKRSIARSSQTSGEGRGNGGTKPLPAATSDWTTRYATWLEAVQALKRRALVFPLLSIVLFLTSDKGEVSEFSFVTLKIKPSIAIAPVVALAMAILLTRLSRDLYRLLCAPEASLDIEVLEQDKIESLLTEDYLNPVDCLRQEPSVSGSRYFPMIFAIDLVRTFVLGAISLCVAIASIEILVVNAITALMQPASSSFVLWSIYIVVLALVFTSACDVCSLLSLWTIRYRSSRRPDEWHRLIEQCEADTAALDPALPLPAEWPPKTWDRLASFQSELKTYRLAHSCKQDFARIDEPVHSWWTYPDPWPPETVFNYEMLKLQISLELRDHDPSEEELLFTVETARLKRRADDVGGDFALTSPGAFESKKSDREYLKGTSYKEYLDKEIKAIVLDQDVRWIKRESRNLDRPVRLPKYWGSDDRQVVNTTIEAIKFNRWLDRGEFWSDEDLRWLTKSHLSLWAELVLQASALGRAAIRVYRHPAPPSAALAFFDLRLEEEWWLRSAA